MPQGACADLTGVQIDVSPCADSNCSQTIDLGAQHMLPLEIGLVPHEHPETPVTVTVTALHDGHAIFARRATASYVNDSVRLLEIVLAERCSPDRDPLTCDAGSTCGLTGCESEQAGALPPYTPRANDGGTTAEETCNGIDDDGDGFGDADENFGPCEIVPRPAAGQCRDGVLRCIDGATLRCEQRRHAASTETCNDGVDNDCDGAVDNGASCAQNYPRTTSLTIGSNDPTTGEGDDAPAHPVCVAPFTIDRYEVSFRAFVAFLASLDPASVRIGPPASPMNATVAYGDFVLHDTGGGNFVPLVAINHPSHDLSIDALPNGGFRLHEPSSCNLPVVNVTWFGADAYCRWAGKHLPTEAEFMRAYRGPTGTAPFPWGDAPVTCERANVGVGGPDGGACSGRPMPWGSMPMGANPENVFELYGNVNEWMWDWLDDAVDHTANHYYQSRATSAWCTDFPNGPLGPTMGSPLDRPGGTGRYCEHCRFARGRHYQTTDLRPGIRKWIDPDRGDPTIGFRCSADGPAR